MSYITFKTIGESGNLGSQLQQYASLYAVAKQTNKTIVFPESSLSMGHGFKFAELVDLPIQVAPDNEFADFVDFCPNDRVHVDESVYKLSSDINHNIVNRFDNYRYWHNTHASDVFGWNWNPTHLKTATSIKQKLLPQDKELVAIHVRRGDYLLPQHNHFCKLDVSYYNEALQNFTDNLERYHFVIFSNDIQWCKENLIEGDSVTFIEPGSDYVDLILMSLCDHFITANSSYSWWAAYKSKNLSKIITCPTNYLKNSSPWSHLNGNYYPQEWKNINNPAI